MNKAIGLKRGTVRLVKYNPKWIDLFRKEKDILLSQFSSKIMAIEHIGSTAIPGLPAKPIIDINVAVESLDNIDMFVSRLPALGYEYIPERRFSDRQFFPKGSPENRTHHLNIVEITSETGWENPLLFRDFLRKHDDIRKKYADLKVELATNYYNNREEYTKRKGDFVMKIINKAKEEIG